MLIKHNYPKVMLIEMSGLSSLIAHTLNAFCGSRIFSMDDAYAVALYTVKYHIDVRCIWLLYAGMDMNKDDLIKMFSGVELMTPEMLDNIIVNGRGVISNIEQSTRELLDAYVPRNTWNIWSVQHHTQYSICLTNRGDYRIAEWAATQENANTVFAQNLDAGVLGAE